MSSYQRVGSCVWKVIQVGAILLVLGVVVLAILFKNWRGDGVTRSDSGTLKTAQQEIPEGNVDVADLMKPSRELRQDVGTLADGSTQVRQTVLWQIIDGVIYYRIILNPYDAEAHQLMASPLEALFISFVTADGMRVAPKSAAERIETRLLRVATKDGRPSAWFYDGRMPIDSAGEQVVEKSVVGWFFTSKLHARLRKLPPPA